jgi:hypothetical protein
MLVREPHFSRPPESFAYDIFIHPCGYFIYAAQKPVTVSAFDDPRKLRVIVVGEAFS